MLFELRALRGVKGKVAVKRAGSMLHTKSVPCHHGMARPQDMDTADGPQIWVTAATMLKFSREQPTRDGPMVLQVGFCVKG
jgi:hypothetical protein